jgi:hypothetical protein
MKRALFLTMVILLVAGFATAKTPVTPITKHDLKDLKGSWTGERIGRRGGVEGVDLIIFNDSLPLVGEVTLHWPRQAAKSWPCKGHIKEGRLIFFWQKESRSLNLGLRKDDGTLALEGYITGHGERGMVLLKKVQE